MADSASRSTVAVVAGATGLVGQELVRQLAADGGWREVRALVRRPSPVTGAPTVVPIIVDYARLDAAPAWAAGVHHVFSALGTTMREAGSRDAFREVDFAYPLAVAKLALAHGARHYLLVSAVGADAGSRVFYNHVKGDIEQAILALGYRSVTIARPSLLLGPRAKRRLGEQVGKIVGVLAPPRWRPVEAAQVARGLITAARRDAPGVTVLDNAQLRAAV